MSGAVRAVLCVFCIGISAGYCQEISSAYWCRVESGCDILNPLKSFCNASPERVGEFLNPWGSHVQVSWLFSLDIGSVHSKANMGWLTGTGRMEKKKHPQGLEPYRPSDLAGGDLAKCMYLDE